MPLWGGGRGGIISCTNEDEQKPHHTTAHYKEAQEVRERSRLNHHSYGTPYKYMYTTCMRSGQARSGKGMTVHVGHAGKPSHMHHTNT